MLHVPLEVRVMPNKVPSLSGDHTMHEHKDPLDLVDDQRRVAHPSVSSEQLEPGLLACLSSAPEAPACHRWRWRWRWRHCSRRRRHRSRAWCFLRIARLRRWLGPCHTLRCGSASGHDSRRPGKPFRGRGLAEGWRSGGSAAAAKCLRGAFCRWTLDDQVFHLMLPLRLWLRNVCRHRLCAFGRGRGLFQSAAHHSRSVNHQSDLVDLSAVHHSRSVNHQSDWEEVRRLVKEQQLLRTQ